MNLDQELQIVEIVIAIVGGVFIAWYWNRRKHRLEMYRYLDQTYHDLLRLYRENPDYGNPELTANYEVVWKDEHKYKYHYFAMTAHTIMEAIYDFYGENIPDVWSNIFDYHTSLHVNWLSKNQVGHGRGYLKKVLS